MQRKRSRKQRCSFKPIAKNILNWGITSRKAQWNAEYTSARMPRMNRKVYTSSTSASGRSNEESLFERSFENHLLRVRSILGRMKRKLPSRIEPNVSKPWPLIGLTTSRCLLKERTFFLEN